MVSCVLRATQVKIWQKFMFMVVEQLLKQFSQASISKIENCRLAEPGEFTKIAFQNGKINLLKAKKK